MWLKQYHKPPDWEWFIYIYIPPIKMVKLGMVYCCFTNIKLVLTIKHH